MIKISYIVTVYDRPDQLLCVLANLMSQTMKDHEIIVMNTYTDRQKISVDRICDSFKDLYENQYMFLSGYFAAGLTTYHASNEGAGQARGEWLCFPSDDSYYVPVFAETMIQAAESNGWDLVYCDMLYDRRNGTGKYSVIDVQPRINAIDKTGFIIRRSVFEAMNGFENLDENSQLGTADGQFIEKCVARGVRHGKVHEVLAVHN